jgi:hypothetical protein
MAKKPKAEKKPKVDAATPTPPPLADVLATAAEAERLAAEAQQIAAELDASIAATNAAAEAEMAAKAGAESKYLNVLLDSKTIIDQPALRYEGAAEARDAAAAQAGAEFGPPAIWVKAKSERGRRRAGFAFTREPMLIYLEDLHGSGEIEAILSDPELIVTKATDTAG